MFGTGWETSQERGVLPEGLAEMEPGDGLAATLATIDRSTLNGHELVLLLKARSRQIAHLQAQLYQDIWELAFTVPGDVDSPPERSQVLDEFVADELSASLTLSPRGADAQLSIAYGLSELPAVADALRRGLIDLHRVRVFLRETGHLEPDEARSIVDQLIADAPGLTTGQLAARLRRRCLHQHPDRARKRHEQALAERRVGAYSNPDGTADLCARQLPKERAAAIFARINVLARQSKGQDDRTMDEIRADVFMDLLEGRGPRATGGAGGVEIRVDLTTLLGLNEEPGEIPGWGPIIADIARRVVEEQPESTWAAIVTHPVTGEPVWTGTTRRRPTTSQRRHVLARNQTCVFPGCSMPAIRSQIDHTIDHAQGGPTAEANLGPLCARHHLRSKPRAGWGVVQVSPGRFLWTSPRRHCYEVRPPPP